MQRYPRFGCAVDSIVVRRNMSDVGSMSSETSDEDQPLCPLCYEPMDETDLKLYPCPCNFQVPENRNR